jgi:hypothetical protein
VALLSYLRGVVLYVPAQGEVTDEYERALAGSARAFKAIGELEGTPSASGCSWIAPNNGGTSLLRSSPARAS